jgi:hypothetical protein
VVVVLLLASISNVVTAWATLAAALATVLLAFFTWRLASQAKAAIGQDAEMLKAATYSRLGVGVMLRINEVIAALMSKGLREERRQYDHEQGKN